MRAADLDGDGGLDVLSASALNDTIAWYENDGSGQFSSPKQIFHGIRSLIALTVHVADLDNDGDLDLLSAAINPSVRNVDLGPDEIAWYENDGSGQFSSQRLISTAAIGSASLYTADLDGDHDLDVLSASSFGRRIAWYENDGSGQFSGQRLISTTANGAQSVYATDLDGDGDLDVLSASANDNKIAWYENDGLGQFTSEKLISVVADGAQSVHAADLDGDGDMDVLSASADDDTIAWYENE